MLFFSKPLEPVTHGLKHLALNLGAGIVEIRMEPGKNEGVMLEGLPTAANDRRCYVQALENIFSDCMDILGWIVPSPDNKSDYVLYNHFGESTSRFIKDQILSSCQSKSGYMQ